MKLNTYKGQGERLELVLVLFGGEMLGMYEIADYSVLIRHYH